MRVRPARSLQPRLQSKQLPESSLSNHLRPHGRAQNDVRGDKSNQQLHGYLLPLLQPADFEAYRRNQAFHKWRHRTWSEGLKMPTQLASGRSKCFCGAVINLENTEQHVYTLHMDLK
jgi:hypothetical protein